MLRHFPHRSREDLAVLRALNPAQRAAFDRFLHAQHDEDERHRAHVAPVPAASLEALAASARHGDGAGGGRRRRPRR